MAKEEAIMLISRSDRGLLAQWWFTVDRLLLSAVLLLMASGVLISMAASPPVAERIGVDSFHFFRNQLMFLLPAIAGVWSAMSMLNPRQARRAVACWSCRVAGADGGGAEIRSGDQGRASLDQYRADQSSALGIRQAGLRGRSPRGSWPSERASADMPGTAPGLRAAGFSSACSSSSRISARRCSSSSPSRAMLLIYGISWIMVGGPRRPWRGRACSAPMRPCRMSPRASTASSIPTRATRSRSIPRRRPSRMAASWDRSGRRRGQADAARRAFRLHFRGRRRGVRADRLSRCWWCCSASSSCACCGAPSARPIRSRHWR